MGDITTWAVLGIVLVASLCMIVDAAHVAGNHSVPLLIVWFFCAAAYAGAATGQIIFNLFAQQ